MSGNIMQDENGNWVPAKPIGMTCERYGCNSTNGKDYLRNDIEQSPGWENEPIFLCEEHGRGHQPYITEFKN